MSNKISKTITNLFVTFFKIGAFTFGGGWVMIAMMEKDIVDKHNDSYRHEDKHK
jgi:chromate transporter